LIGVGLGIYFLKYFMEKYIPPEENKTIFLHVLVYIGAIFAGLQQIMSKKFV
jgi:hypothetical protein